mgnify:CR=1 FL=1
MAAKTSMDRRRFLTTALGTGSALLAASQFKIFTGGKLLAQLVSGKPRWGFLIDLERCIGCKACSVACKTEFGVPLGGFRSSVKEYESGTFPKVTRSFVPWLCNHCRNPICITECPVDEVEATFTFPDGSTQIYNKRATYQRPDGVVLIDQDRCIGCEACVELCPYKVRFLNPTKLSEYGDPVAEKCTLCEHRLEKGLVPACVNTCQGNARISGDLNDSDSEISRLIREKNAKVLMPEMGTEPTCYYIALNPDAYSKGRDSR